METDTLTFMVAKDRSLVEVVDAVLSTIEIYREFSDSKPEYELFEEKMRVFEKGFLDCRARMQEYVNVCHGGISSPRTWRKNLRVGERYHRGDAS